MFLFRWIGRSIALYVLQRTVKYARSAEGRRRAQRMINLLRGRRR